ncbi:MAG TPA: nucleotide exchange factor GrpE [Clostridiales bacterium]|nr:nucleotide exchange factor GrpE [Clostridiales bacterium]
MEKEEKIIEEQETEEIKEPEEQTEEADKLKELEEKLKEAEDKYLRLFAEFDNYKKRTEKEKSARYADALIDTVAEFLPVLDNLERALAAEALSEDAKAIKEGTKMIQKQMTDILAKLKISEIKAIGEEFNPNLHNAVMHIEDENIAENTVVEEFIKGYIYDNDRVVRHSMVKVAN